METDPFDRPRLPSLWELLRAWAPSRARRRARLAAPAGPPLEPLSGRMVYVPGRGEFFLRDSGGDGQPLMLLHGWLVSADLNWLLAYGPLRDAGYRVLAIDHRGHGRGLRTHVPFRLADCADDAAAVIEALGLGPVIAVGYSMGGAIAQLFARDHPEQVRAIVLGGTSREWQDADFRRTWRAMWVLRFAIAIAPLGFWSAGMRISGLPETEAAAWFTAELTRGSPVALAEAGRELGRFDSRPWLGQLRAPAAVVVTARDTQVPPRLQRALAEQLGAPTFEIAADHLVPGDRDGGFADVLLEAIAHVAAAASAAGAVTSERGGQAA